MVKINIHVIPNDEKFPYYFDENKSFGDLKNELLEMRMIKKGEYYIEVNDHVMNNDMILKDNGIINNKHIYFIRIDCIKIEIKDFNGSDDHHLYQLYMPVSDFKIIKSDENKEVKIEEIKRVIELLKDESSDRMSILEDLNIVYDKLNNVRYRVGGMFLEMNFLESALKIFENEKDDDKKIINLLVIIIKKIDDLHFSAKDKYLYGVKDVIDPLYHIIYNNRKNKINDAIKIIIVISKKYPSVIVNSDGIKKSYDVFLPSNFCCAEEGKNCLLLYKEMIKEDAIKKEGYGSEMIEEILFILEMINKKNDIIKTEEELMNEINNFIIIAKEKGFEGKIWNNKIDIISEDIYIDWKDVCKEEKDSEITNNSKETIKEEEKEKIKKLSDCIIKYPLDIQIKFLYKLMFVIMIGDDSMDDFIIAKGMKNGKFLYFFLPLLFKNYHFENNLASILYIIQFHYEDIKPCYDYFILLYNEMMNMLMKESKEQKEMNEERFAQTVFLLSVMKKGERTNDEIEFFVNSSSAIFKWLGRLKNEKEERREKKDEETIIDEDKSEDRIKMNVNKNEEVFFDVFRIITQTLKTYSKPDRRCTKADGIMGKTLLEIIKNHLKNERCLIEKGNKKEILEYIIYCYVNYKTFYLLSLPSHSYPFSHYTIISFIEYIESYLFDTDCEKLQNEILTYIIEVLNNYIDMMKIIDECDVKKEIEKEISIEWNDNIINELKDSISFGWSIINHFLSYYLRTGGLCLFDNKDFSVIKRIINLFFIHSNNKFDYIEKDKDRNNNEMKEIILIRPFIINDHNRSDFIENFMRDFVGKGYYSLFNVYYLIRKSKEECDFISMFLNELSGEIVDRIENRRKNNNNKTIKERRSYERERNDDVCEKILRTLKNIMNNTFRDRHNEYIRNERYEHSYIGKEKEFKEAKDYISDVIEEEDMRECLNLFLKTTKKE